MAHGLSRRVLRNHLRRVSGTFARAFEADLTGARPPDHVAFHVGDRHDRVVESRKHMRDPRMNVLAAFSFDDLRLLDIVSRERKIFRSRCSRGCGFFFLFRRLLGKFRRFFALRSWLRRCGLFLRAGSFAFGLLRTLVRWLLRFSHLLGD
jgi:hypothetical protein